MPYQEQEFPSGLLETAFGKLGYLYMDPDEVNIFTAKKTMIQVRLKDGAWINVEPRDIKLFS